MCCSFFFSKGKGKTRALDRQKEIYKSFIKTKKSSPPPPDYEYIPCEQMAEFPVVALWGNENAELLFFILLVWGFGLWGLWVERVGHVELRELVI